MRTRNKSNIVELKYVAGDLILLGKAGNFDVIAHGNNCFNNQKKGVAKHFNEQFSTGDPAIFTLESNALKGDINKLGTLEWKPFMCCVDPVTKRGKDLAVCNLYTQYRFGTDKVHIDYDATRLCFRKMNFVFSGKHIGLPKIGCGLAGGDWMIIERIIKQEFKDCQVTIVNYEGLSDTKYEDTH